MKKLFLSLAALMMMTAPVMTSCSSEDLDEVAPVEEVKENVVTLTIKMPEQAETRVGIDDESLKLTGWEEKDVVKVYYIKYNESEDKMEFSGGVEFKCIDPAEGTFTGTLPAGKTLSDYNIAVYGRDVEYNRSVSSYVFFSANEVRDNLKDCICLAGPIKNGGCTMSVYNNVIKVTNEKSPVTGAWKRDPQGIIKPYGTINDRSVDFAPGYNYNQTAFDEAKITIPSGISYIFMPKMQGTIGFFTEDGKAIIPEKTISTAVVGKLYKITIPTTTGTAKATIGEGEVDVKWVQLWAGGPKFAEKNIGASDATQEGTMMTFAEATKTGDEYVWGANWCTPSKDDMDELLKAATSSAGSEKVKCEYTEENGAYGFKFTGKEDRYTENSVFFPAQGGISGSGDENYWSGTAADGSYAWSMYLSYGYGYDLWYSDWESNHQDCESYVRPVLKN